MGQTNDTATLAVASAPQEPPPEEPALEESGLPDVAGIEAAAARLARVVTATPLQSSHSLSDKYCAQVLLKREDQQVVRSFKIRGAYNKICGLSEAERQRGVVCASAGNHSQGVAYACAELGIAGKIFMPAPTPAQKVKRTRDYGRGFIEVVLTGDTFDDAYAAALAWQQASSAVMVHPFNDREVAEGQGTVAREILRDAPAPIDYLLVPVGGGGLAAGIVTWFRKYSPATVLVGVEPAGAASMSAAFEAGENAGLQTIDNFVDGAAVKRSGDIGYRVCRQALDRLVEVPEGLACVTLLELYSRDGIVAEPAGALSVAALELLADEIRDKRVVCIVSGGNNDIDRMGEIRERALLYEGRKHYFVLNLAQRPGSLREFVDDVLGPQDDIVHFEYSKKTGRNHGPVVIGIETPGPGELNSLRERMAEKGIRYEYLNNKEVLFRYLV